MPYFLCVDPIGIAEIGNEFPEAPGPLWKPGTEANYLQRWDGEQWIDTEVAAQFRAAVAAEQAAMPAVLTARQIADAKAIIIEKNPIARANRAMARLIAKRLGDVIDAVNVLIARENARTWSDPPIPLLTKTPWPQLLAAAKATIAAETDPET